MNIRTLLGMPKGRGLSITSPILLLLLTACSTPEVVTKCSPPNLILAEPLPSLPSTLTEQQAITQWLQDIQKYKELSLDHNALVKWIKERC